MRGDDWPQVQHDAAHTGYTRDEPQPPFRLLWSRDLQEPTATASQVIAAEDKVFVTTNYGNLYALDQRTGETVWAYRTEGPILGAAAHAQGRVYVNSMDHCCHAVDARSGRALWKFPTGEGLWAAPVIAAGTVFVAGRDGFVYAVEAQKGTQLWRSPIGGLAMCTPACAEGRLYVAAGDMHVYAFDAADGRQLWKSPRIPGAAIREYWLTVSHGTILLTSQLAYACHPTQQMIQRAVMNPYNQAHQDDPVLRDEETFGPLQEWLASHPQHRTLLVLNAATGREKFVAPIITVNGGSCIGPVPAVTPDGWAYTIYANIQLTASGWAFLGRYNLNTGVLEPLMTDRYAPKLQNPGQWHWQPKTGTTFGRTSTWDGGFSVIDQSWGMSIGGGMAFPVRDPGWPGDPPFYNSFRISTRQDSYLLADWNSQRARLSELNRGTVGGGAMHNTCSPVAVAGNRLFHKSSRSVIFAFEGTGGRAQRVDAVDRVDQVDRVDRVDESRLAPRPRRPSSPPRPPTLRPPARPVAQSGERPGAAARQRAERPSSRSQASAPPPAARASRPSAARARPAGPRPPDAAGQSWLVDLDAGWPTLSRVRGHLPLDVYRGARDVVLTVALDAGEAPKPQIEKSERASTKAAYPLASGTATAIVSRLSPAVLFETPADRVDLRGDPLPKYVAFIADGRSCVRAVGDLGGAPEEDLKPAEPWILLWFGDQTPLRAHVLPHDVEDERGVSKGPDGYGKEPDRVDLPVLIRVERPIQSLHAHQGSGLVLHFADRAGAPKREPTCSGTPGKLAIMPLAGGRLFLPEETERWAKGLPEEVVARCRQWSARLAYFPAAVHESFAADPNAGTVTFRQQFEWTQFEDQWASQALKSAPVPPVLALALGSGLPVHFSSDGRPVRPEDYDFMDTAGPAMGIDGVDEYEYTLSGLKDLVAIPSAPAVDQAAAAQALQAKLEKHVRQMVEAGHLAPLLYIYGGIGGTWFSHCYWGSSTELALALGAAYPYLSQSLQAKVLDYLRSEWQANPPFELDRRNYLSGRSRTPYELPRSDMERHLQYAVGREADYRASDHLFDLYGIDNCLRLTNAQPEADLRRKTSSLLDEMSRHEDWAILGPGRLREVGDRHAVFYYNLQGAATYNRWLAGAIGAARLAGRYGWTQEQQQAWRLLARLAIARVAQARYVAEMHRHGLVRGEAAGDNRTLLHLDTGCAVVGRGPLEVGVHQNQEAPPFNDLVEEVGRLLGRYARPECRTYLEQLDYSLPLWYISEAPKEQATEHRTTPLQYYSGNVLAQYWILGKRRTEFGRYLDTTRFTGDLYYIRNLAACLRSYGEP